VAGEGDFDPSDLKLVADRLQWPVLGTATSGLRGEGVITTYHHLLVDGVRSSMRPDLVVTVGRIGPSDRLGSLTALEIPQIHIDRWGSWDDPRRQSTRLIQADPVTTLRSVEPVASDELLATWVEADVTMRDALDDHLAGEDEPTGPSVARSLSTVEYDWLIAASSMPIRDVDAHTVHKGRVIANRGASGIDGFVSTALGVASAGERTLAIAGDLSMLHDAGGLVADLLGNIVFVVIDNGGGGLFDLLPQAEHAPGFERLFVTPHGLDISRLAQTYGLGSVVVERVEGLAQSIATRIESRGAHVVVVPVERETELKQRRALDDTARVVCAGLS
jgi:2-succinyl-5-enolpyruvyl-6-hydroxy-3-cyclohexene-1-carboxylate synthase